MATTAKGTPYVESSDLVANYPAVSLALAEHIDDFGGKFIQVVRATDVTPRTTTSTSLVDSGMSITITPQRSTSAILLISSTRTESQSGQFTGVAWTDSSNNNLSGGVSISGANANNFTNQAIVIAYTTPGTTSAITYKVRFLSLVGGSISLLNGAITAQLYAIEVSA